jgi:hypothetical protein
MAIKALGSWEKFSDALWKKAHTRGYDEGYNRGYEDGKMRVRDKNDE